MVLQVLANARQIVHHIDGFVFHAQRLAERLEVRDFARIVVVAQRRGDNAG